MKSSLSLGKRQKGRVLPWLTRPSAQWRITALILLPKQQEVNRPLSQCLAQCTTHSNAALQDEALAQHKEFKL